MKYLFLDNVFQLRLDCYEVPFLDNVFQLKE